MSAEFNVLERLFMKAVNKARREADEIKRNQVDQDALCAFDQYVEEFGLRAARKHFNHLFQIKEGGDPNEQ